jgi:hypothetical protein
MILHTGGLALGETSTKSFSAASAFDKASSIGTIPICLPFSSISLTGEFAICSFT